MSGESWFKAVGSLTARAIEQDCLLCGNISGGRLLCGGDFTMRSELPRTTAAVREDMESPIVTMREKNSSSSSSSSD